MHSTSRTDKNRRQAQSQRPRQRKFKKRSVTPTLILFAALLALLVVIFPKEPTQRAVATVGTDDGKVVSATVSEVYSGLVISEIMAANRSAVPDDKGEFSDYVELWNSSDKAIDLHNVGLSDDGNSIRFIFPAISLAPNGRVVVFASDTNQVDITKPFHAKFKISSIGETIYLFDPNAYVIDQVTTPIMNANASYSLMEDGTFQLTEYYSPGFENTEAGFLAYRNESRISDGVIVINEVMADAKSNLLLDEDGDTSDWVEIYNRSDEPFALKNVFLSNKESKPLKWKFPDDAVIPARGYYVVFCSGKDRGPNEKGIAHTNFKISAERDVVLLSDSHGRLIDRIAIDNLPADKTYGRSEQDQWQVFNIATPGLANNAAGAAISDQQLRAQNPTGVYITEVMASNNKIIINQGQDTTDWVELYNPTNQTVYLEGYGLSDDITRARKWQFPAGAAIYANSYLTVYLDGKPEKTKDGQYHTNFKLLRAGGETICFSTPVGLVLDKIDLPLIPTNISYGRTLGLNGFFYYDAPTPGAPNGTGFYGYADTPAISTRGGLYYDTVNTTITVPFGTVVYYTTDGSIPTTSHTRYEGETITFTHTGVLRARAFKENYQPSDVVTQTYFINTYHTLPIVEITIDPDELYNEQTGMFVAGPNIDKSNGIPFKNAIYRQYGKNPRECYVEYYSLDNEVIIHQGLEVSLSGANSLDIPQKSLKFRAKSLYGAKYIDASLFADREFTQYKSFVLRMGGNDGIWTRVIDGLQSQLVDELNTSVIHQAWDPVAVYINGIYWGHYNMRERKDRYFVAQHEGLPLSEADNMDIIKGSGRAEYGSAKEYNDLIKKAKTLNTATNEEDLKYLTDRIDVENCLDYLAIQMFFGNSDIGNMQIYKLKGEGQKFKWLLYDMDYGLFKSTFDSPYSYLKAKGAGQDNVNNTIWVKLLENDGIRDQFLTRLGEIFQIFTTDHMIAKLDEMTALIEPELSLHYSRWAEYTDKAIIAEAPNTPEGALRYWKERVRRLREETIRYRPPRFYDMVQKQFKLTDDQMLHYFGEKPLLPPGVT